ncbi:hypothetical protein FJY71_00355 [candidate division WOR-3 bacterium]|nr:hypothetical protein [candidate division WOR-3 bacterium]
MVRTRGGLFSVLLGSVAPVGAMPDAGTVYVGMAVGGGSEMVPRLRIVSAAYAFKADTANYASASGGADNAWVRGVPDSVLFTVKQLGVARGGAENVLYGGGRHTHVNLGVACTTGTAGRDYEHCTVSGGVGNAAAGSHNTVAGGLYNSTADEYATVGGGGYNRASGGYATVAGGQGNSALAGTAAVGGGKFNVARGMNSAIAGGKYNTAAGYCSAVGGGVDNVAESIYATVAGGSGNTARGYYSAVAGGFGNLAAGDFAVVAGGRRNFASGEASLAAGTYARTDHAGCFVWGDSAASEAESVSTTGSSQFRVRARGGTWFFSDAGMTAGVYLAPGSNSWASACDSANKTDFRPIDRQSLLERVAALRVRDYRMRDQHDGTRHIGPVAQDFHAAFGYGETNTGINTADADGVLLVAVQALCEQNREMRAEIVALKAELARR